MTRLTLAAALAATALLPLHASTALAQNANTQIELCDEAPAKAAKAGIDCTATSDIGTARGDAGKSYPDGPVTFGSGVVF
ncbi:MAG: hypothetical protein RIA09_06450 [Hoeflea sp.]|uniref:hypothetical protein n=1 Tax=Hoeflea sp. TaxID=1940281 RepID=UPI0032EAE5B0